MNNAEYLSQRNYNILTRDNFTVLSRLVLNFWVQLILLLQLPKELGLEAHTIFSMTDHSGIVNLTDEHEPVNDAKTKYAISPFLFSGSRNKCLRCVTIITTCQIVLFLEDIIT